MRLAIARSDDFRAAIDDCVAAMQKAGADVFLMIAV